MDISKLKRQPDKIWSDLKTLSGNKIITQSGCKIYIPEKYQDHRLVTIGVETYILGICAFVVDDLYYGVSKAPTMLRIEPDSIATVKVDDVSYFEFTFDKNSAVIANTNVVQDDKLLYAIYNEFIAKGSIPWYITYRDLGELFSLSKEYTGVRLGANHVIHELIAATITRDPNNLNKQFRHVLESKKDLDTLEPRIIKLNSVSHGATNTTAKLIGAYWDEGVTSALVNPSERIEPIEDILRR